MKKIFLIFVLGLFSVLAFYSCRSNTKSSTGNEENNTEQYKVDTSGMNMGSDTTMPM